MEAPVDAASLPPAPLAFVGSASGEIAVRLGYDAGAPPPLTQAPPPPHASPAAAAAWLRAAFLAPGPRPGARVDVARCGHSWISIAREPNLWTEPAEASFAAEPALPQAYAGAEEEASGVGFEEVEVPTEDVGGLPAARRRASARQGSREFVRGRAGGAPLAPGGAALGAGAVGLAAAAAGAEEEALEWLAQYEAGAHPAVAAPGVGRGAFGAWAAGAAAAAAAPAPADDGSEGAPAERALPRAPPPTVEDLFAGVWLLEGEDAGEAADEEDGEGALAPPGEERAVSAAADADTFAGLPDGGDLPGGVDAELAGLFGPAPGAGGAALAAAGPMPLPGAAPRARRAGDAAWAVRGAIPDLAAAWAAAAPGLARTWPFELDAFQKEAILHMEAGRSVFVAAHTSAGKTVAAEYAFALAARHRTRAVYTAPIKTISNQKFRDFSAQGVDVGLLTGDVAIRPEAPCLIMTTEVLRSMLYKGADVVRDIEWVIFDEVHYVNDEERGVVWEEVIIMLPPHVSLLLLSATVPNVDEFAGWVGRTKRRPVHVTGTARRPVPLEHAIYHGGQLYVVGRAEGYDAAGYKAAKDAVARRHGAAPATRKEAQRALPTGRGGGGGGGGRGGGAAGRRPPPSAAALVRASAANSGGGGGGSGGLRSERSQWVDLLALLKKKELLPCVVFCFSKKRVDALAENLRSVDLTSAAEKSEVHLFLERAFARLRGSDRELPQVLRVREMLRRGVGVHHAGLLPIVKEAVEMLFCRGLTRMLFCTETFAMGVNAPARCVVFQSLRKHDGRAFRTLLPGEYTQMAGRAGRRGLDAVGTVLLAAWEELPDEADVRRLLTGSATRLESQFRLTYSMILNLLRVEGLRVEDMMRRSFAEHRAQRAAPEAAAALARGRAALARLRARPWPASPLGTRREEVEEYAELSERAEALGAGAHAAAMASRGAAAALAPGRVVLAPGAAPGATEVGVVLEAREGGPGGGTAAGAEGGARAYVVLSLHRASPLDALAAAGGAADAAAAPAAAAAAPAAPAAGAPEPMRLLRKKGDDLDAMMGGMRLAGKKGGGFGAGAGFGARAPAAAAALPLPRAGEAAGLAWRLAELPAARLAAICKAKVRADAVGVLAGDAAATAAAVAALAAVRDAAAAAGGDPPAMDPVADLKVASLELVGALRERGALLARRAALAPHADPLLPEMLAAVRSERALAARLAAAAAAAGDAGLAQLPEYGVRVRVLQRLGYLDAGRSVTLKGRVACEINTGDELVGTEILFGGVLAELDPTEAAALLSALVYKEKSASPPALTPRLAAARDAAAALALAAGEAQRDAGLDVDPDEFVAATLNFGLMEAVHEWARGTPFREICGLTDAMEGSVVRTMVRLDETCRELRDAARVMGDVALFQQMEAASAAIKRDIVFAASLYVA